MQNTGTHRVLSRTKLIKIAGSRIRPVGFSKAYTGCDTILLATVPVAIEWGICSPVVSTCYNRVYLHHFLNIPVNLKRYNTGLPTTSEQIIHWILKLENHKPPETNDISAPKLHQLVLKTWEMGINYDEHYSRLSIAWDTIRANVECANWLTPRWAKKYWNMEARLRSQYCFQL